MQSSTPQELLPIVWPLSLSLATTQEISVDFSSSPYLDVSVQAVSLIYLCIQYMMTEVCSVGLRHSDICGSKRTYRSPQLIAVNHVLRRLPMPRHSPCALCCFTICFMFHEFSKKLLILNTCSYYPIIFFLSSLLVVSSFALLLLYSVFKFLFSVPENRYQQQSYCCSYPPSGRRGRRPLLFLGGHKWTRTIDLTLIRRAL